MRCYLPCRLRKHGVKTCWTNRRLLGSSRNVTLHDRLCLAAQPRDHVAGPQFEAPAICFDSAYLLRSALTLSSFLLTGMMSALYAMSLSYTMADASNSRKVGLDRAALPKTRMGLDGRHDLTTKRAASEQRLYKLIMNHHEAVLLDSPPFRDWQQIPS